MNKKCNVCNKEFYRKPSVIRKGKGKYCSRACFVRNQMKQEEVGCINCGNIFLIIPSRKIEKGNNCSRKCYDEWKQKQKMIVYCQFCNKEFFTSKGLVDRGQGKFCSETCQHLAYRTDWWQEDNYKPKRGKDCPFWLGGRMAFLSENEQIRKSSEYRKWRKDCMERDHYTCQLCGVIGRRLQVDHIKPFSLFPELRFVLENGRTLCEDCHKKTETYGGKIFRYMKGLQGVVANG